MEICSFANLFHLLFTILTSIPLNLLFLCKLFQTASQTLLLFHLQHTIVMCFYFINSILTLPTFKLSQSFYFKYFLKTLKISIFFTSLFNIFNYPVKKLMRILLNTRVDRFSLPVFVRVAKI